MPFVLLFLKDTLSNKTLNYPQISTGIDPALSAGFKMNRVKFPYIGAQKTMDVNIPWNRAPFSDTNYTVTSGEDYEPGTAGFLSVWSTRMKTTSSVTVTVYNNFRKLIGGIGAIRG
jgi:hypothetical protein